MKVIRFFGTDDIQKYIEKFNLNVEKDIMRKIAEIKYFFFIEFDKNSNSFSKKTWEKMINEENEDSFSEEAIDLLDKMLTIDHVF